MFFYVIIFSLPFALLFIIASALITDYPLHLFYDAGYDKSAQTRKYTRILTVCVVGAEIKFLLHSDRFSHS